MKQIDYKTEIIDVFTFRGSIQDNVEKILNEYGEEGYRLINIIQYKLTTNYVFVFSKEM